MKALIYKAPSLLEYEETKEPIPLAGEALVRVKYVGICGSDMHAFLGHDARRPAPLILGHEAAGVIVGGEGGIGRHVTINPLVGCQKCVACENGEDNLCPERQIISMPPREGAFGELVTIPIRNIVDVPEDFPLEKAALCEPIACGWHAVKKCRHYLNHRFLGSKALVQGGGAIGVGVALCLKAMGIEDITLFEPHKARANYVRDALSMRVETEIEKISSGFDMVIDAVGFEASRAEASDKVRSGGIIAHIGLGSAKGGIVKFIL